MRFAGNSYTYGSQPHAVTGRVISGVSSTFTYDYENRAQWAPAAISGGATASFVYDADAGAFWARVKSTVGGVTTIYIAGLFEFIENGATDKITKYYAPKGFPNAMRRSGYGIDDGVFYLLQDHLNSSSGFVDQAGNTVATNYYYPYGGNRGGTAFSGLSTKRFTGQYHESSLPGGEGLSYYNARWYDAQLGRFLSADTIVPGAANPQAFNRYSYVFNNPMKYTDPTGHCIFGLDTIVCIIAAAALAGGAANATGSAGVQIYQNWESDRSIGDNLTDFNKTEVGIAFGYGAVSGGLAPVTGGATALVINGGLGAAQEVTTDWVVDGSGFLEAFDSETAIAAGFGIAGGMIQNSVPDKLVYSMSDELGVATGKDALANGGRWFAQNTNRELLNAQIESVTRSRFLAGAGIGNVPLPEANPSEGCSWWSCPIQTVQNWWNGEKKAE